MIIRTLLLGGAAAIAALALASCGKPAPADGAAAGKAGEESVSPGLAPKKTLDSFRNAAEAAVQERENGLREADQHLNEQ
ncbi:MAG: hypothetical protein SOW06_05695 [Succinivibrionaceae bacterium]|nr:hypothetical protein [Pseudomonadota bacterium]MDY3144841.1 hypothetical protein [Succinivibrionaceae bacterium]MDD6545391.1 hypothetical protein [Pseudomonadota bacterium]MDY6273402.1 hypothetical protein [Succinivibrionaceae bacterium]MDY6336815.1 hypothetical protein [Succinivibrionaceae bacterium]